MTKNFIKLKMQYSLKSKAHNSPKSKILKICWKDWRKQFKENCKNRDRICKYNRSIYTIVYYEEKFCENKNAVLIYGFLGILCSATHVYFVPIVGIVLCAFVLISIVKSQKILQGFLPLISFLSMVIHWPAKAVWPNIL